MVSFGKTKSRGGQGASPEGLITFGQGSLQSGGFGSFQDVMAEIRRLMESPNDQLDAAEESAQFGKDQLELLAGEVDPIQQLLREEALTRTDNAAVSSVLAARQAGGGRGGLAFGTGASEVAARGARDAAVGQSAALGQSLVGAAQARTQRGLGIADAAGNLSRVQLQAGTLLEERQSRGLRARQQFLQLMAGIAGAGVSGVGGSTQSPARGKGPSGFDAFGLGGLFS